jgi:hypothetical protein
MQQQQGMPGQLPSQSPNSLAQGLANKRGMSASPLQNNGLPQPNMQVFPGQPQPPNAPMWQGFEGIPDGHSPSDSWSTGSAGQPAVPSTLNVEDW